MIFNLVPQGWLAIEPLGGLANRMRVIASAIHLASRLNTPLRVYWYRDSDCNCRFDELFESMPMVTVIELSAFNLCDKAFRKAAKYFMLLSRHILYIDQSSIGNYSDETIEKLSKQGPVYLATFNEFSINDTFLSLFKPTQRIMLIATQLLSQFDENVVGVHVRRTDNIASISNSPIFVFYDIMDTEISKNNTLRFFVATDDDTELRKLFNKYENRIMYYSKRSLKRTDNVAIVDALVDLYCLSKTRKVIGSHWSSFSDIAARWGGIELVVAKSKNKMQKI